MSVTTQGAAGYAGADASMDDILASIRAIIAEEPLSLRHRPSVSESGPVLGRVPKSRKPVGRATAAPTFNVQSPLPVPTSATAAQARGSDDILGELLADALPTAVAITPNPALDPVPTEGQVLVSPSAEAPDPMPIAKQSAPEPLATPPENEVRAAATVLDALAAGLAAATSVDTLTPPVSEAGSLAAVDSRAIEAAVSHAPQQAPQQSGDQPAPILAADIPDTLAVKSPSVSEDVPPPSATKPSAALSFEDTIAGMLRPLLREWLDANLPRMVDAALRAELSATGLKVPVLPDAPASPRAPH